MRPTKLNLGCASRLLEGYLNIDMDSLESIIKRYPGIKINKKNPFLQADILNLNFPDSSIDEIRADALVEHLSFKEESRFFYEIYRLLKPGGLFRFDTPDFEWTLQTWINAKDDWKDFYRDDEEAIKNQHWFGNYAYSFENRWGYLMASIFGPQCGLGQYHKNAYTEGKIISLCEKLNFEKPNITRYRWKSDRDMMLKVEVFKPK